jgi:hypothetical protein
MRGRNDVFILGKHHPKATEPAKAYRTVVEGTGLGVWLEHASIQDCIALSDRVAAVNSSALYEAIVREIPILTLGLSLLHSKGISYEVTEPTDAADACSAWLSATDWNDRLDRWRDFTASLIAHDLYALDTELPPLGVQGPEQLAAKLVAILGPRASAPGRKRRVIFPPIDEIGLWDRERIKAQAKK